MLKTRLTSEFSSIPTCVLCKRCTQRLETEMGGHLGLMPFDAFTITPSSTSARENTSMKSWPGGQSWWWIRIKKWGIQTPRRACICSFIRCVPLLGERHWNCTVCSCLRQNVLTGKDVYHHDIYGLVGGGVFEQAFLPDKDFSVAPTIALGLGARIFLTQTSTLRLQLRDDILLQNRTKTEEVQNIYIKQILALSLDIPFFNDLELDSNKPE